MAPKARTQVKNVIVINTNLINKQEVFKLLALAHSTGFPVLLEGPPGVGKTKVVLDYAKAHIMKGMKAGDKAAEVEAERKLIEDVFILETDEGTKASEIKGMPDLGTLFTQNRYELDAPIANAEIVIINEVDKASSAIRNSLLGVMNEKYLFNGKTKLPCKWKLFIATCNEIPKEEVGSPFWDRFVLKHQVGRISAGEMLRYYEKGGKDYHENMSISIPTKEEMETVELPSSKLSKYLDVAYSKSTDRTLTFVPTLVRTVALVWDESIDRALVRVAGMQINASAGSELQSKLTSPEVKNLQQKIEMLFTMKNSEHIQNHLKEIEALMQGYITGGKLDQVQAEEIEEALQVALDNHPIKKKEAEVEELLSGMNMDEDII